MSRADADDNGRYVIRFKLPNPCVRPEHVQTQKLRVTGKHNMEVTRRTLSQSGYTIVQVRRTNWWG